MNHDTMIAIGFILWIGMTIFSHITLFGKPFKNPFLRGITTFILFPVVGILLLWIGIALVFVGEVIMSPALHVLSLL